MNRLLVIVAALVSASILCMSCASQQGAATGGTSEAAGGPSAAAWRNGIKGQWTLHSIDKENFPTAYSVKTIFEEAPAECFVGSVWNLPNNGRGTITFNTEGTLCAPGAVRNIVWSIYNPGKDNGEPQFQFKKIYPGDKPSNVTAGYRLDMSYADEQQLTLRMPLELDGQVGYLVFNFERL
ncbi:lipocalin family protein [Parapedobacter sp. DT-150]|uniref:lipocalin family protein n=1 Tax=Parapedobacter sp. DT-150 TaxID=3396162 RepID=UPI003F1D6F47